MLYMLLLHWNEADPPMPGEEAIANHFTLLRELEAKDAYVFSEAVAGAGPAKTVRMKNGAPTVTDGPYAETKEVMGGFYILDCKDLDEAVEYAKRLAPQGAIDIRPVMDVPDWPYGATANRKRHPM